MSSNQTDKSFMDPEATQVQAILERHNAIQLAFIFGSTANGKARSDSDLDIGLAATTSLTAAQKLELMDELAVEFGRPIDLVDLTTAPPPILSQILTKGVCILKKDVNLYAALIKKVWYDQADFMPNYNMILQRRRQKFINNG